MALKADSRRMKGILQQYDTDAAIGFQAAENDIRERSRSLGRELKESLSEKNLSRSPVRGLQPN